MQAKSLAHARTSALLARAHQYLQSARWSGHFSKRRNRTHIYIRCTFFPSQAYLADKTGQRTVPNIFIGGKHLGGCDDILQAEQSGQLKKLLGSA